MNCESICADAERLASAIDAPTAWTTPPAAADSVSWWIDVPTAWVTPTAGQRAGIHPKSNWLLLLPARRHPRSAAEDALRYLSGLAC